MTHCYTRQTLPILPVYTLYMCYYCSQFTADSSPLLDKPLEVLVKPYINGLEGKGIRKIEQIIMLRTSQVGVENGRENGIHLIS